MRRRFVRTLRYTLLALMVAASPLVWSAGPVWAAELGVVSQELVSAGPAGVPANDVSPTGAGMTPDGRYVVFMSNATNLVQGQTTAPLAYYLRDRVTHQTELVSRYSDGSQMVFNGGFASQVPSMSADGRFVVFAAYPQAIPDRGIYLLNRTDQTVAKISSDAQLGGGAGYLSPSAISRDGNVIAYHGTSSANGQYVTLVYLRQTGETRALGEYLTPTVSANGQAIYMTDEQGIAYKYTVATQAIVPLNLDAPLGVADVVVSPDETQIMWRARLRNAATRSYPAYWHSFTTGQTLKLTDYGRPTSFSDNNRLISYGEGASFSSLEQTAVVRDMITGETISHWTYSPSGFSSQLSADGHLFAHSTQTIVTDVYDAQIYVDYLQFDEPDSQAPQLGASSFSPAIRTTTGSSVLTIPATDNVGVTAAEYYLGDVDPGLGQGQPMILANAQNGGQSADATATFGAPMSTGVYPLSIRARDAAGNWSSVLKTSLVVHDPTLAIDMSGKNKHDLVPSLDRGDIMPGLIAVGQNDAADYGISVQYRDGAIDPRSDFYLNYLTGSGCGKPAADNCHSFSLVSTTIDWLVVNGVGGSEGRFQGVAQVTIDGITTSNPFTAYGLDGDRLTPAADDTVVLRVYAPGADPVSASPMYQVSGSVAKGSSIKLN